MPIHPNYPGVYLQEKPGGTRTITGVATAITAFIGRAKKGPVNEPVQIEGFNDYERDFGGLWLESTMSYAVRDFFLNGGRTALIVRLTSNPESMDAHGGEDREELQSDDYLGSEENKTGLFALLKVDLFNLLCIPPPSRLKDTSPTVYQQALRFCVDRRAILLVDAPSDWGASAITTVSKAKEGIRQLGLSGTDARNAALYFPRVRQPDSLRNGKTDQFVPCGIIAGIISKTDAFRGVWKSPAGTEAVLTGIQGLQVTLTDYENSQLNSSGINCLRSFPASGTVIWGARTLSGADQNADEYKYIAVRRTALFIEESLYRGLTWVVFEPNDESLWAKIRLTIGSFLNNLFRQGAFQGRSPAEAYFVKCDKETTTQNAISLGFVNILVGFAPLKPAEFIILRIQLKAIQ